MARNVHHVGVDKSKETRVLGEKNTFLTLDLQMSERLNVNFGEKPD